jgi:hypothetical protein
MSSRNADNVEQVDEQRELIQGSDREEILRQRQLIFVGKVLAGLADKMQTHWASIQDLSRRLEERLEHQTAWPPDDKDRFAVPLTTIEKHLQLLIEKCEHLNRFSKRTSLPISFLDAGEVVEETVSFWTRFARVRKISLSQETAEALPSIRSDPVQVHFLLSVIIQGMLERLTSGGEVVLRAAPSERGVVIKVEGHGTSRAADSSLPENENPYGPACEQVVNNLGGSLQKESTTDGIERTALFLPVERMPGTSQGAPDA